MYAPTRMISMAVVATLAAGCSCNKREYFAYEYGEVPEIPTFEPPSNYGQYIDYDVAPDGQRVTMAYYNKVRGAVGYASGIPDSNYEIEWFHESVDGYATDGGSDPGDIGKYASQRTMPDGTVWVVYYDGADKVLRGRHRLGPGDWEESVVVDAGDGDSGHYADMVLDGSGNPVVVHCDKVSNSVRVATLNDGTWSSSELYRSSDFTGQDELGNPVIVPAGVSHSSIAVDGDKMYIAFNDRAKGSLEFAEGSVGSWATSTIDDDGDVGRWSNIYADSTEIVIAYQDVGNQDLKVATRGGSTFDIVVVDDAELKGAEPVVFKANGTLSIAYFDGINNDLALAERSGTNWDLTVLYDQGPVGYHNSVLQHADITWVGTYDMAADELVFDRL